MTQNKKTKYFLFRSDVYRHNAPEGGENKLDDHRDKNVNKPSALSENESEKQMQSGEYSPAYKTVYKPTVTDIPQCRKSGGKRSESYRQKSEHKSRAVRDRSQSHNEREYQRQ